MHVNPFFLHVPMKRYIIPALIFSLGTCSGVAGTKIHQMFSKEPPADASMVHYLEDIVDGRDPSTPTKYSLQTKEDIKDLRRCYGILKENGKELYRLLAE